MHIIAVISTVIIGGRRSLGRGSLAGRGLVWIIEGFLLFFKCLAVVMNYAYAFLPTDSSSSFLATCLQSCLSFTFTKCSEINIRWQLTTSKCGDSALSVWEVTCFFLIYTVEHWEQENYMIEVVYSFLSRNLKNKLFFMYLSFSLK